MTKWAAQALNAYITLWSYVTPNHLSLPSLSALLSPRFILLRYNMSSTRQRPSTSAPGDGSRTITIQDSEPTQDPNPAEATSVGAIRVRATNRRDNHRVVWDEDVVDNEGCGRKSSKSTSRPFLPPSKGNISFMRGGGELKRLMGHFHVQMINDLFDFHQYAVSTTSLAISTNRPQRKTLPTLTPILTVKNTLTRIRTEEI